MSVQPSFEVITVASITRTNIIAAGSGVYWSSERFVSSWTLCFPWTVTYEKSISITSHMRGHLVLYSSCLGWRLLVPSHVPSALIALLVLAPPLLATAHVPCSFYLLPSQKTLPIRYSYFLLWCVIYL